MLARISRANYFIPFEERFVFYIKMFILTLSSTIYVLVQNQLLCLSLCLYGSCISLRFTADFPSGMTWRNLMMWSKGVFHSTIFRGKSSLNSSSLGCKMHENQNKHTSLNMLFYVRQCSLSHTTIRILWSGDNFWLMFNWTF